MRIIAHRGFFYRGADYGKPEHTRYGENTRRAFREALARGADGIEFDVRRTECGKLVVIHDPTLDRTTNFSDLTRGRKRKPSNRVSDLSFGEFMMLDAGFGERVPLLSEILDIFGRQKASAHILHIELKEKGLASDVLTMIQEFGCESCACVSAFDENDSDKESQSSWKELSRIAKDIPVALAASSEKISRMGYMNFIDAASGMNAAAIHPEASALTPRFLMRAHDAGLLVNVWTVTDIHERERLETMGVDGAIADISEQWMFQTSYKVELRKKEGSRENG